MQDTNAQAEEEAGIRCNFETECLWKWDKTQNDTFQVVTGNNITDTGSLLPGPSADNTGNVHGKCFIFMCSVQFCNFIWNYKFKCLSFNYYFHDLSLNYCFAFITFLHFTISHLLHFDH